MSIFRRTENIQKWGGISTCGSRAIPTNSEREKDGVGETILPEGGHRPGVRNSQWGKRSLGTGMFHIVGDPSARLNKGEMDSTT